ncbi:uncharacterized protein LOC143190390 [Rhynchophorus ferrugineus]|uniref:Kazal-like domain-containing protein n=1 Tax=Rhynchophorus ferrugineus TaxID=354439 RepID=A0A834IFN5_RHYFE|nr:hypothetical protein GWI33_008741 [Rhynchophorus ferrugineus]
MAYFKLISLLAIIAVFHITSAQETQPPQTVDVTSATFRSCFRSCPTINNYNPVCGSDGVTYDNIQKLQCAQRCGQNVQSVRIGSCSLS